jgi:glyoxylase-like metal-dependent hydrolase (beta-lactamase superfamily II)
VNIQVWTTSSGYLIKQVLHRRCNVFLILNGTNYLLVDTNRKKNRNLLKENLSLSEIKHLDALILTHTHFDHAENAAYIRNNFGAKVIVHKSEAEYLQNGNSPLPSGSVTPTKIIVRLFAYMLQSKFAYESCEADILVDDQLNLSEFGFDAHLIHTPGHSCGMMSLIIDDEIAIVGDTMFGIFPGSVFPPYADNVEQLVLSWSRLLDTKCRLFIPAHGKPVRRDLLEKCYKDRLKEKRISRI